MISSAFFSFLVKRTLAACSSRISFTRGLTTTFGPRFLGVRDGVDPTLLPLPPPDGQVRGVEPPAPQQKPHGAGIMSCIGLVEDGAPILGGEAPSARAGDHLGIGYWGPRAGHRRRNCLSFLCASR